MYYNILKCASVVSLLNRMLSRFLSGQDTRLIFPSRPIWFVPKLLAR